MTTPRRVIIALSAALALSLSANAFMGGLMVVRHGMIPPPMMMGGPDGPGHRGGGLREALREMPEEIREPIVKSLREDRGAIHDQMAAMREARRNLGQLLKADTLDVEALRAQLAEQRGRQSDVQAHMHEVLVNALIDMPPDARKEFAEKASTLFR